MGLLTDNLYESIINTEAPSAEELRIISGYGSASFLKRVKQEYPHLKIDLFLGMTSQGISKRNHIGFKELTNTFEDIAVYYEVRGIPNHMKIVEFRSSEKTRTYLGSANFTENGFVNQKEVMTLIETNTDMLFEDQQQSSLICTDEEIERHVPIYLDDLIPGEESEVTIGKKSIEENETTKYVIETNKRKLTKKSFSKELADLRSNSNKAYYNRFEIEAVLEAKNSPRWDNTGINAWKDKKVPTLVQTPRLLFNKIFPVDEIFEIFADDGNKYMAKLTGRFDGELELINGNIYEYVKKRINLNEHRPISREDLERFGNTKIQFERIDKLKYLMSFGLDN